MDITVAVVYSVFGKFWHPVLGGVVGNMRYVGPPTPQNTWLGLPPLRTSPPQRDAMKTPQGERLYECPLALACMFT